MNPSGRFQLNGIDFAKIARDVGMVVAAGVIAALTEYLARQPEQVTLETIITQTIVYGLLAVLYRWQRNNAPKPEQPPGLDLNP